MAERGLFWCQCPVIKALSTSLIARSRSKRSTLETYKCSKRCCRQNQRRPSSSGVSTQSDKTFTKKIFPWNKEWSAPLVRSQIICLNQSSMIVSIGRQNKLLARPSIVLQESFLGQKSKVEICQHAQNSTFTNKGRAVLRHKAKKPIQCRIKMPKVKQL